MLQRSKKIMINLCEKLIGPQNMNDTLLQNRMKLCFVAIGLMWLTTHQISMFISSIIIPVPDFSVVYSTCSMTCSIFKEKNYATCVKCLLDKFGKHTQWFLVDS